MKSLNPALYFIAGASLAFLFAVKSNSRSENAIPFNPDNASVHYMPTNAAANLTALFRKGQADLKLQLKDPSYLDKSFSIPLAEKFNRDVFAALLNEPGAQSIRIYMGRDENGLIRMVLVGVDGNGKDLINKEFGSDTRTAYSSDKQSQAVYAAVGEKGKDFDLISKEFLTRDNADSSAFESGQRCPTLCDMSSVLMKNTPLKK